MRAREEGVVNLVGEGTSFNGTMEVRGSVRIDGECEGELHVSETLIVGKKGRVKGDVRTKEAIIGGKVIGSIFASNRVEFQPGASLEGDLICKLLVIEEGAHFDGSCKMGEAKLREVEVKKGEEVPSLQEITK